MILAAIVCWHSSAREGRHRLPGLGAGRRAPVVVCVLAARGDEARWRSLCRRLRMAAMLEHPAVLAVYALSLEDDSPHVVLGGASAGRRWHGPGPRNAVVRGNGDRPGTGPCRGRGCRPSPGAGPRPADPREIRLRGRYTEDRLHARSRLTASPRGLPKRRSRRRAGRPGVVRRQCPDAAADVYAGVILFWLLRGRPFQAGEQFPLGRAPGRPPETDARRRSGRRPSAEVALRHLAALLAPHAVTEERPVQPPAEPLGAAYPRRPIGPPNRAARATRGGSACWSPAGHGRSGPGVPRRRPR